jgi:uncharacterized protein YrrD
MIQSLNIVRDYAILATDGTLGSVSDIYFDDRSWAVRYLVVDTGTWLPGRKVLIPTSALGAPDSPRREFPVNLTREQVKSAPSIDEDKPVSRQHEADLYGYYGWAPYWGGGAITPGLAGYAPGIVPPPEPPAADREHEQGDPSLRSGREVVGYGLRASDGDIGHVEDILIEDEGWRVRYLLIDTRNWLPGRKVVIAPDWVRAIDWTSRRIEIDHTRDQVKGSPEYNQVAGVSRAYERGLYEHYGRTAYWM